MCADFDMMMSWTTNFALVLMMIVHCAIVKCQDQSRPSNVPPLSTNTLDTNYNNPYGASDRPYTQDGRYDPYGPTPDSTYNRYPFDDRNYLDDPQYHSIIKES